MTIPKIIFRYSPIYDDLWGEKIKKGKKVKDYPSGRKILNYIKKVEKLWRKDEKKVLTELSKITHLKWEERYIYCYVVGKCIPFSFPTTLPVYKNLEDFIDTLIHELIHRLFIQEGNIERSKRAWKYFHQKYKKESRVTGIHVPLQAIHTHIYLKFYNEKRLEKDLKRVRKRRLKPYKRAWKIIEKEGYKKIINEFVRRIQK
jgi:hypothetical protein